MTPGLFTVILGSMPLEQALDYAVRLGAQAVELGAGAYAGTAHCDVEALLASDRKAKEFLNSITCRGLKISALNCAGNPIHPNRKRAAADDAAGSGGEQRTRRRRDGQWVRGRRPARGEGLRLHLAGRTGRHVDHAGRRKPRRTAGQAGAVPRPPGVTVDRLPDRLRGRRADDLRRTDRLPGPAAGCRLPLRQRLRVQPAVQVRRHGRTADRELVDAHDVRQHLNRMQDDGGNGIEVVVHAVVSGKSGARKIRGKVPRYL